MDVYMVSILHDLWFSTINWSFWCKWLVIASYGLLMLLYALMIVLDNWIAR